MKKIRSSYLETARIINTYGVHGDMKAEIYADSPAVLKQIKVLYLDSNGLLPLSVSHLRMQGDFLLFHAEGIETPEDAAKYKTKTLYAKREDIPKKAGDHFIVDLIGLPVLDADTKELYGTLTEITENPANPLYEVKTDNGTVLIPCVKEFIIRIDEEEGIFVRPIPGMFSNSTSSGEGHEI